MKRWGWLLVVLAAVVSGGRTEIGTDVGKLQPVQVVRLSEEAGQVKVETDTGAWGVGDSVGAALDALHASVAGEVVLDTAEFLVSLAEDEGMIQALAEWLRPSCVMCYGVGEADLETVGAFLEAHRPELTLMRYRAGERDVPRLTETDGRLELVS